MVIIIVIIIMIIIIYKKITCSSDKNTSDAILKS